MKAPPVNYIKVTVALLCGDFFNVKLRLANDQLVNLVSAI